MDSPVVLYDRDIASLRRTYRIELLVVTVNVLAFLFNAIYGYRWFAAANFMFALIIVIVAGLVRRSLRRIIRERELYLYTMNRLAGMARQN